MRTIVITGASDGIGASAARILHRARPEDRLVLIGRDPAKTAAVAESVDAEFHTADFSRLDEVRALADDLGELGRIDVLANNAGGVFPGPETTVDGFEKTWQVNVVAPYLLTNLLLPTLVASRASVVATASVGSLAAKFNLDDPNTFRGFTPDRAYANAKLGNILFAKELHRRFHDHRLSAVAFHPGVIATNFAQERGAGLLNKMYGGPLARFFGGSAAGGENLAHFIAGVPGVHWESGRYYDDRRRPGLQRPIAKDLGVAKRVFDDLAEALNVSW